MNQPISVEWPKGPLGALLLVLILVLIGLDLGRSATGRLTVVVGSIRLLPPTIVPMEYPEAEMAAQLLGGAITDYLAASEEDSTS